jgi:hypothetical protein
MTARAAAPGEGYYRRGMGRATAVPAASGTVSRVSGASSLRIEPVSPLPERLAVGKGTAIFLDGVCSHPDGPLSEMRLSVDGVDRPLLATGMPAPGAIHGDGYWWAILASRALAYGPGPRAVGRRSAILGSSSSIHPSISATPHHLRGAPCPRGFTAPAPQHAGR